MKSRRAGSNVSEYSAVMPTPFGPVGLQATEEHIVAVTYLPQETLPRAPTGALARETCKQIRAYLRDPKHRFDLPYLLEGSDFEQRVWAAIAAIASGTTRTYGEIAARLATSPRPVGRACGSNPVPLIVPCHRVVAANGALGGFMHSRAAGPLTIKHWLLHHEGCRG
jgi:methylated-DNA-[protein]-cysteine S-methyltransferase